MHKYDVIDDNVLGMFVDDQLDPADHEWVLNAMEDDPVIRRAVYKLRRAKDLIRLGFGDARVPERTQTEFLSASNSITFNTNRWKPSVFGVAASVLIITSSFFAGYYLGFPGNQDMSSRVSQNTVPMAQDRVLLHVSESDPRKFSAVLTYTRKFLERNRRSGRQVAVVAHAGGLDMMREGPSPVKDEIMAMMLEFKNVHFMACANSILALREKGVEPTIIKNIDATKPAMEQIISHIRDGWSYIRVKELPASVI